MLDTIDLSATLSKEEFRDARESLSRRLGELQRQAREAGVPVLLVFEGLAAAGMGTVIGRLLAALDPRGYRVHTFIEPVDEAALRPPMWRYWLSLPARGGLCVYDGSWYGDAFRAPKKRRGDVCERINLFERQQTDDGALVMKFWLHVSEKEQGRRFKKLAKDEALAWKITRQDWRRHQHYERWCQTVDGVLECTHTACAPWHAVPGENLRFATIRIGETIVAALERAINKPAAITVSADAEPAKAPTASPLDSVDLGAAMEPETYEAQLEQLQAKLLQAEHRLYLPRIPVVIVYEGWDASGKGGNIKRLVSSLDHRGFEVIPVAAPVGEEKTHHYLWRFWKSIPKGGHITIFDRSWYGRVLVERVEGFATACEWQRAYREINEFEAQLAEFGTVVVKFWVHISKDEQLRRFELRQQTPHKTWKITEEDWRNRQKWDQYYEAVSDMLEKTSTPNAPWTVIEGNQKQYARIKAIKTVLKALERRLSE